jgi:murein DD-endopeptidase MepM/ murein hydrolase activator NlpD
MRTPLYRALGAAALLLLPTHLPVWMDTPLRPLDAMEPPPEVFGGVIRRNVTLAQALSEKLSPSAIHHLVEAARPAYDLARVAVGRSFRLTLAPDGVLAAFSYEIDELRTLKVERDGEDLSAEVLSRSYEVRTATTGGTISSSLFNAVGDAGEQDQLALDLAEIFAWDVDFNTEIQAGDSFQVAVEKMYLDDRFCRYGRILAAEFVRGARTIRAVRFDGDHATGYYAPDGTPLRKAFLRSPLKFSRISSGFSRARFHPILKTVRPHLGVDYAAPAGTPVHAAGDGVVTLAGWNGGYGKAVRIRHPNGYETLYGHLSRISVKRGQRVSQGGKVGAVGRTGLASGPHLDYRMIRNGVFVNPLKVVSPPAEPVPAAERAAFEKERDSRLALLKGEAPSPALAADRRTPGSDPGPARSDAASAPGS